MKDVGKDSVRAIEGHYRTGVHDLRNDFFERCFKYCDQYSRASGYFSSTALLSWLSGIDRLIRDNDRFHVRLIISNELSERDAKALEECCDENKKRKLLTIAVDKIINMILSLRETNQESKTRVELFAWLIANGHIELKFAFPTHLEQPGIFHEKIGIFSFPWGDKIAFTGSANETGGGHSRNYESVDVYRNWIDSDIERVEIKELQFKEAWKDDATGLDVVPMSKESIERVKKTARKPFSKPEPEEEKSSKWIHQDEAVARFLKGKKGILEMATGTGKTRTAFKILSNLLDQNAISGAIVTTDGTDLLSQWVEGLGEWVGTLSSTLTIYSHFGGGHDLGRFCIAPSGALLVISRAKLPELMRRLNRDDRKEIAVVHDEVHGLGMPGLRDGLLGQHNAFPYVLGLSATPDRAYDQDGNRFIESEVGPSIFKFPIEAAIARGILCEFDYVPLSYKLTKRDKEKIQQVFAREAAAAQSGNPMSKEQVWIELSKVYKLAEMKPAVFADYVENNPEALNNSIIFVETREYGEQILEIVHQHTNLYRTYYAEDDTENLVRFSKGEINCLITCHKISQGIDIQSLQNVFLLSSARAKLETVQRIGRCLRADPSNPNKKALVVDFCCSEVDADLSRRNWLEEISTTRRGDEVVY